MRYRGIDIVVTQSEDNVWFSGFKKNPMMFKADSESRAFELIREFIDNLDPTNLHCYEKYGDTMNSLEEM